MDALFFYYLPPFITMIFFLICISIAKKIKHGEETYKQTIAGSVMIVYLVYAFITTAAYA